VAVGAVLLLLNDANTTYTTKDLPTVTFDVTKLEKTDRVRSGQYASDSTDYKVLVLGKREKLDPAMLTNGTPAEVAPGRYLIDADGKANYRCDPAINGSLKEDDEGKKVEKYNAPKTQLVAMIIDGILERDLPWNLVIIGVLIAVTMELCGVPSLAFAVGVYLPISSSMPIFLGGLVRWITDKARNRPDEGDSSPGVLLSSGYIAGGALATLLVAAIEFVPSVKDALAQVPVSLLGKKSASGDLPVTIAYGLLAAFLFVIGAFASRKSK